MPLRLLGGRRLPNLWGAIGVVVPLATVVGCGSTVTTDEPPFEGSDIEGLIGDEACPVDDRLTPQRAAEVAATYKGYTAADLATDHAVTFEPDIPYDPATALGLTLIQGSSFELDAPQLARLSDRGFVIDQEDRFPTFTYGYASIYGQDLPVFVSADSILFAIHRSYDDILEAVERKALAQEMEGLLRGMHAELGNRIDTSVDAWAGPRVPEDLDLWLSVAISLLSEEGVQPHVVSPSAVAAFVELAEAAGGLAGVELFGTTRSIDFSQFESRGHYENDPVLQRYFRAMMWIGRVGLRLVEPLEDGSVQLNRRQVQAAFALTPLIGSLTSEWTRIDKTLRLFVGVPDSMTPATLPALADALGIGATNDLDNLSDEVLTAALVGFSPGASAIVGDVFFSDASPLREVFLFPQRYSVDSLVLSNVVYGRVPPGPGGALRLMPNPLDVAFGALGNDHAAALLTPELEAFPYAEQLASSRALVDDHADCYWDSSLYGRWIGALRSLSDVGTQTASRPGVTKTEPWARRLLNSQLASWAELRHATILYAKPTYTEGIGCEFPDAYVDPYPELFAAIEGYSLQGLELADVIATELNQPNLAQSIHSHFDALGTAARLLREMAEHQQTGTPHSPEHLAFINDIVVVEDGLCGVSLNGWYTKLFFEDQLEFDPTIADVHTQPTDEYGNIVGRVLHVATGSANPIVVTVETCSGPRAYVGLTSSYYEVITEDFARLKDSEWAAQLMQAPPPRPVWASDL